MLTRTLEKTTVPSHLHQKCLRQYSRSLYFILLVFLLNTTVTGTDTATRPNIIFIFADDLAYDVLEVTGEQQPRTPHLDHLARAGAVFTHAYNQGGWHGAICVASRSMLNTGRFLWHAQRMGKTTTDKRGGDKLWSQYFHDAGYTTFFSGKWHLQTDVTKVFDIVKHVRPGMPADTPASYDRPRKDDPWKAWDPAQGGYWQGGKHWSEVLASDACDFLKEEAQDNKPFFMYLAFNAPHDPRQAPKEFIDAYPLQDIAVPESFVPEYPYKDAIGCDAQLRDERLAPFPRTPHAVQVHRQEYYAIISHLDQQIGRIIDAIKKSEYAENTLIIFSADHGLAVGNHGLLGKQNMFDHSVRVPFILQGPGIEQGQHFSTPIYLQDVMPTALEFAEIEVPAHIQFRSLVPILRKQRADNYDAIYGGYMQSQRMIIQDGFKLILYPTIGKTLLFNLQTDPNELNNLATSAKEKKQLQQLFAALLNLQKETGDTLDLKALYPILSRNTEASRAGLSQ